MFKTKIGLNSVDETITRPVLIRVVEDINKHLGFHRDIYYTMDENETIDRTKNKLGDIESYSSPRNEHIIIDYEEDALDGYDLSMSLRNPNYEPIYEDPSLPTVIKPIYLRRKFTLNYKYISKSKSNITRLINMLRTSGSSDAQYVNHDLVYHYNLPMIVMELIEEINTKKNNKLTTPVDLETYVNTYFDSRVDTANTPDGDSLKSTIVIKETQKSVIGYITGNMSELKKEEVKEESAWSVNFTYEFNFEYPTELLVEYPLVIYNQLISKKFREIIPKSKTVYKGNMSYGDGSLMDIQLGNMDDFLHFNHNQYYLAIPEEDTYLLPRPHPDMARFLSIITIVDETNPNALFNISEIPKIKFKDPVLNLWRDSEYPYVGITYKSIFYIDLYKDGVRDYSNEVIMDSNLNLTTKYPMEVTSLYRVVFNVITDVNLLRLSDKQRIEQYIMDNKVDGSTVDIVKEYAGIFGIPESEIPYLNNDFDLLINITDNSWVKYYTQEEYVTVTAVLENK